MFLLQFYRFYIILVISIIIGFLKHSPLLGFISFILLRTILFTIERLTEKFFILQAYKKYHQQFKDLYGPYGIRIINKAESDSRVRNSLYEVFTFNKNKLKKNVEQLEMLETLFKAGMRPDGDEYLLHDLKLKFGKYRIEKNC